MAGELQGDQLRELREWGAALASEGRDDMRAAGRAIVLLVDEVVRLSGDRPVVVAEPAANGGAEPASAEQTHAPLEPASSQELAMSLRERLAAAVRPGRTSSRQQ